MKKKFFIKLFVHALTLPLLYILIYRIAFDAHQWMRTKNNPHDIYVIGDSRSVHGLDIEQLGGRLGRTIHSYSTHGMSVYNVFVVAETVPPGATVMLSPSLGMLLRRRDLLTYKSGLSVTALRHMVRLDYEWWYFRRILEVNRYPLGLLHFTVDREVYPNTDEPDLVKVERFTEIYGALTTPPPRFARNKRLLDEAIAVLLAKGCDVRVVEFPVSKELIEMRNKSIFRPLEEELPVLRANQQLRVWTNIQLEDPEGQNLFYDLDHLNERGRGLLTEWLLANVFDDLRADR